MSQPIKRSGKSQQGKAWAFVTYGGTEEADFLEEIFSGSDRVAVIVGLAYLEDLIQKLVKAYFVADQQTQENLLDPTKKGVLSSFAAQVDIAFLLGLLTKDTCAVLKHMARVRNKFAHNHGIRTFEDLKKEPGGMKILQDLQKKADKLLKADTSSIPSKPMYETLAQIVGLELGAAIQAANEHRLSELKNPHSVSIFQAGSDKTE